MSPALKGFLRAIAAICLWGSPLLALLAFAGSFTSGFNPAMIGTVGLAGIWIVVVGFLIGGVLRLLLSIDDRLERLEGNR